jgi:hypothetical protein
VFQVRPRRRVTQELRHVKRREKSENYPFVRKSVSVRGGTESRFLPIILSDNFNHESRSLPVILSDNFYYESRSLPVILSDIFYFDILASFSLLEP